ncbi:class I poly(R)-hydroxyalkanoic acid synthase [Roseospira marina]|uniref:Class I poly(R)-hydroxyalkanoic acid synthase n=1 Tax=Roseospira marina TaxID=140057 RepID=A0A5M6IFC4_9PROT|nr:class I poly(R)-hydroxyalkanoic acid synthase [Roseospira marina]KAA5606971.1 class I poly(R)-hydroxyalkanoic acid synthase [Roseospira marina]MBB4312851.1 polyhydroxyalkanoate synthase [Roseospira marina]MBB5086376.1 polyhydroxyalkanoate synthase [Roseospira marina]
MADQQGSKASEIPKHPDPQAFARDMAEISEHAQKLFSDFLSRQASGQGAVPFGDPLNVSEAFLDMTAKMMSNPAKVMEAQFNLWQEYMALWQNAAQRWLGQDTEPLVQPDKHDMRFRDEMWQQNEVYDFIKQSYLLTSRWMLGLVHDVEGDDSPMGRKADFYIRQFVDAMAPTNFVMTNPQVLRTAIESNGESLLHGLENMLADLERGKGQLRITMTDEDAFKVGENIVTTPGKVIHQNRLMQLIQYSPSTESVYKRPLLIIPPWINKFYILDLREKNSFVRWAVAQGHTVFMISWINPDESYRDTQFDDYLNQGPIEALSVIEKATGETSVNAIGYCLGGTLLGMTLAWLQAKGQADRIASATHFTTMLDFSEPGELGVFIDPTALDHLEEEMFERGYLDGAEMATTFNMLRSNDLIWSFVVNNYLMGKEPFPFDLLYWNSDSTRMPAAMHSFYLRKCYLENALREPGAVVLDGVPLDLTKIKTPAYFLSSREDHIAPWVSTFRGSHLYGGPVRFVLAASGHIAGVINPPAANKYCHWIGTSRSKNPETWLAAAKEVPGSWWPDWAKWIDKHGDGQVPAREPGSGGLKPIEDAPGQYVKIRAV